ncbi:MAG: ATP-dependent Clp protease proteolytic subunit [Bacilli bacterium]|nr:ATP-dependent Clp protease proteolytic subunit [Bacilli bacterium]
MEKDFRKFYGSLPGSKMTVYDDLMRKKGYQNPYILEEKELHVTQLDIFSRLMIDRQIFFASEVTDETCSIAIAQLLYMDAQGNEDITINIMSPGGSCSAGMGLIDTIGKINSDVRTINISSAYSMGLVLLVAGKKGKRVALPHSEGLLHMPLVSGGISGPCDDIEIQTENLKKTKQTLFEFIGMRTGHTLEEITEMAPRDRWMTAQEMLDLGFVDEIQNIDWSKK